MQNNIDVELSPFGQIAPCSGFFTNGEFYYNGKENELLNQSISILTLSEKANTQKKDIQKPDLSANEDINIQRVEALSHLLCRTSHQLEDLTDNLKEEVENEIEKNSQKDKLLLAMQAQAEVGSMMEMIVHQWRQPLNGILNCCKWNTDQSRLWYIDR